MGAAVGSFIAALYANRAHKSSERAHESAAETVRLETYLHTRIHDLLNSHYRISLALAELLRRAGVKDFPDPPPPFLEE